MRLIRMVIAVLVAAAGLFIGEAVQATTCSGEASTRGNTATSAVSCPNLTGHSPGGAPHAPAERVTGEMVWRSAGCSSAYDPEINSVSFVDLGPASLEQVQAAGYDESGVYHRMQIVCLAYNAGDGSFGGTEQIIMFEVTPPVDPAVLRDRALARVTVPDPSVGMAPAGSSDVPSFTQLETWLWVDTAWSPLVDSESQGFVTVEVRVRPRSVVWDMGDGHVTNNGGTVECGGPGVVWSEAVDARGTDCGYTYRSSTVDEPDGVYHGSATVTYDVSWSINGVDQGSFATLQPSTPFSVEVAEMQVVNS